MKNFRLRKISRLLLLSSLGLHLSCATKPPDIPLAVEITPDRAYFVHVMSGKSYEVNETNKFEGKSYWELSPSMIHMPASSWRQLKVWIINICNKTKQCGKEVQSWERTVQIIDTTVETRLP